MLFVVGSHGVGSLSPFSLLQEVGVPGLLGGGLSSSLLQEVVTAAGVETLWCDLLGRNAGNNLLSLVASRLPLDCSVCFVLCPKTPVISLDSSSLDGDLVSGGGD